MGHKQHSVIIKGDNNKPIQFPLKIWVRQNLDSLPEGFDSNQTSHEMRRLLKRYGWRLEFTATEALIIKPDENGNFDYANSYIANIQDDEEAETMENEEAIEITFGLEKDLQAALRKNIETLEKGLTIIDSGKERNTEAGRIDITARDAKNRTVIIELKAIDAKPDVIAQTLAYMEAIKTEDNVEVRGIIVASGFPDRVKLAARQINNVRLVKYAFQFSFDTID